MPSIFPEWRLVPPGLDGDTFAAAYRAQLTVTGLALIPAEAWRARQASGVDAWCCCVSDGSPPLARRLLSRTVLAACIAERLERAVVELGAVRAAVQPGLF